MGIRFSCHHCGKRLNIKRELAGRRGVCPACNAKFRIPISDTESSLPVDQKPESISENVEDVAAEVGMVVDENPAEGRSDALGQHESEATWYVRPPSGGQFGPASTPLLQQWINEGRVAANSLLWRDGWPQWRGASDVLPDLAAKLPHAGYTASPVADASPSIAGADSDSSQLVPDGMMAASLQDRVTDETQTGLQLAGQSSIGTQRRIRSHRRVLWIGVLSAVAIMLVGVLVIVASRG